MDTLPNTLQHIAALHQEGMALHQKGLLSQAQAIYEDILRMQPRNADVMHLLGIVFLQKGRFQVAAKFIRQAIDIFPKAAVFHFNLGVAQMELAQFSVALACFDTAIVIEPNYADAYSNRGIVLHELGQFDEALTSYGKAIVINPSHAAAYSNRGNALKDAAQFEAAIENYKTALAIAPESPITLTNLGVALLALGKFDDALECHDKALEISPGFMEALSNRGDVLRALGNYMGALEGYNAAISINPNLCQAHYNCGLALFELSQFELAVTSFDKAIAIKPDLAEAYFMRGNTLARIKQPGRALASYDAAININPDLVTAYYNRGNVFSELGDLQSTLDNFGEAAKRNPNFPWMLGQYLHTKMKLCEWSDFESDLAEIESRIERGERVTTPFPVLALNNSSSLQRLAAETLVREKYPETVHEVDLSSAPFFGKAKPMAADFSGTGNEALLGDPSLAVTRGLDSRIRLGYFSTDFYDHAVSQLIVELIELHSRERFEVIAFSLTPGINDQMRLRLKHAFDRFIDVSGQTDNEVALLAQESGLDIAIDLNGHTGGSRPGIFAARAAPIQINYLGYPGTMGANYIDYLIADPILIPNKERCNYSEKIVYMPHCYQPNASRRAIADTGLTRDELGLPPNCFVFCCFNNTYKILPSIFDIWIRILLRVDNSVLWLLESNEQSHDNLVEEARKRGLGTERLIFAKRCPSPQHLARHRLADLFLDTFPYNAHTTASESLWAGLPLLTLSGETFPSRVAASLLNTIGLPELVTDTTEEYERRAIQLATDEDMLLRIKQKLMLARATTPLFDTKLYAKHIESAYAETYRRYRLGLPPDNIFVGE